MFLKCLAIIFFPFILIALALLILSVTPLLIFILILRKNEQKKENIKKYKAANRRLQL